jgi:hypothetical protein
MYPILESTEAMGISSAKRSFDILFCFRKTVRVKVFHLDNFYLLNVGLSADRLPFDSPTRHFGYDLYAFVA